MKNINLIALACFQIACVVKGDLSSAVPEIWETKMLVVGDLTSAIWKGRFWIDSVKGNGVVVAKYKSDKVHTLTANVGDRFSWVVESENFSIACRLVSVDSKSKSVKVKYLVGFGDL